jgi:hypothetical protein
VNAAGQQIANPFSTGGGGPNFETKVQSGLFAMLLVHGADPIFPDHHIQRLQLQGAIERIKTDDILVTSLDSKGNTSKSFWSVKHGVQFTRKDQVFAGVITKCWTDFNNSAVFNSKSDALVLATTRQSAKQAHLLTLLEWARAAASGHDFVTRVATANYSSEEAREYLAIVNGIVDKAAGSPVDNDRLWRFLRCFYVLTYDLDLVASQDEARFKTMLGLAVQPAAAAAGETGESLWNAISQHVADLNPRAGTFTRDNLPQFLTESCGTVAAYFRGAVQRLREHSDGHLSRIRTTIGPGIAIPRTAVVDQIESALGGNQFVIVSGSAGSGKSAASILAIRRIAPNAPLFVFQAMEFAREHLDRTFSEVRVTETLSQISSLFALQDRKILLIESVEKLLEAPNRDAFAMLLEFIAKDQTWTVVLTCRSHAVAMVEDAFFTPLALAPSDVEVPLLGDAELEQVLVAVPALTSLTTAPRVRNLLKNPWYLDKLCSVKWSQEPDQPVNESQLRNILWRRIVMRDDYQQGGVQRQRDACFRSVAVARAKSLQSFVAPPEGSEVATQALLADGLLVEEPSTNHVAPAHDVLEDWALIRWIDEKFRSCGHQPRKFFLEIGAELPIRRSFRQWLIEALANTQDGVQRFIQAAIKDSEIEPYWRDEVFVSILLSSEAATFIRTNEAFLLASNKAALMRLIHLLRLACKTPNPNLPFDEVNLGGWFGDYHLVPKGQAWGEVLRLIARNLAEFTVAERPLVLGLLEDWKTAVSWKTPAPDGAREAGLIALHYWSISEARGSWKRELWERLVEILLAAPQAIAEEFEALIKKVGTSERTSRGADELKEGLLVSMHGWAACRSLPDLVIQFARREWGLLESLQLVNEDSRHDLDLDASFGLTTGYGGLRYFPASALQGPFYPLLQSHPDKGINLILDLVNTATARFVQSRHHERYGDTPYEVELKLSEGSAQKQWANARLWMMHRGSMPGPAVMESALMALEKWLLDLAQQDFDLRPVFLSLLKGSNGVAITSVVTSVVMAHPDKFGDIALSLLRIPQFFALDRMRYIRDLTSTSAISMGLELPENRIYNSERADSDQLAHRRANFEWLALKLQTGSHREDVWKIIDDYKAALPPVDAQDEDDKIWRLLLHRIDLRNYRKGEADQDGPVTLVASPPPPELQAVVERAAPAIAASEKAAALLVWGMTTFEGRDLDKHDPSKWREMFAAARETVRKDDKDLELSYGGGPGYVAAMCVRDHWAELSGREKLWCRNYLIKLVSTGKDDDPEYLNLVRNPIGGAKPAAVVLPLLLRDATEQQQLKVREAIASALTHTERDIRNHAAAGMRWYGWQIDSDFVWACVTGLVAFATLRRRDEAQQMKLPWQERVNPRKIVPQWISDLRRSMAQRKTPAGLGLIRLSLKDFFSCQVWPLILIMLLDQTGDERARKFFSHLAKALVHFWTHKKRYESRNYEAESALRGLFSQFSIACTVDIAAELWTPFFNSIPPYAREVAEVFQRTIYAEDRQRGDETFWRIWRDLGQSIVRSERYHELLSDEHSGLTKLASVLLLDGVYWNKGLKHWKPLQGHSEDIREFFEKVGSGPRVCLAFITLLDSVGNQTLIPEGIKWIAKHVRADETGTLLGDRTALLLLARLLTPLVYGRTATVRQSSTLRDAVLDILNAMVDSGSSAAFRMREFLITPAVPTQATADTASAA